MAGTAGMNILRDPAWPSFRFSAAKAGADGKPPRYAPHRLMKEAGVTGAEFAHQVVHRKFEFLRITDTQRSGLSIRRRAAASPFL